MAAPSFTYTLTNGTTADASQVMQDLNDLLNGITDGTKDLSISALTCAGTATLNGHVTLGNSSADDLTITASLASNLVPKTDGAYDIGSTTIGLRALYLGDGSGDTVKLIPATLSADRIYTLPEVSADASFVMSAGTQTVSGTKTFDGQLIAKGTATNDSASAGYIGEYSSASPGGTVAPTGSGTVANVTSFSLTAGDWDVYGGVRFTPGTISGWTTITVAISTSTAAYDTTSADAVTSMGASTTSMWVPTPMRRISLASTTTIYLVSDVVYSSVGSAVWATTSKIWARRVR